ncbi:MAG: AAA family ATPase [Magnetococcales bacterium]|nr:AAA family ATPase [Magnetococcales bacterium]
MRIDQLTVKNFKGFKSREFSFHRQFNLIVGVNGTGKTSALDALAVAVGSWFLGVRGTDSRHIRADEVFLEHFEHETVDTEGRKHPGTRWETVYPCEVSASGEVSGERIRWTRSLKGKEGRTTYVSASNIKELASQADAAVRRGENILLPLISYYGTGRLWQEPRDSFKVSNPIEVAAKDESSRFAGYWNSVDPRLSVSQLTRWIVRQSWIAYQNRTSPVFSAVKAAIVGCVEGATDLYFDASSGDVIVKMPEHAQPFYNLSDGQRSMLAMVGDIAQKAAKLNPHLGNAVLTATPGVVLIDELDLHLHPRWQRRIIDDLRRTFPNIQFICTTHSPFLIQSLRSGEELIVLDGQPTADLANMSVEAIAQGIMGIPNPQVSLRYEEMKGAAKQYLQTLEEARLDPADRLAEFLERLSGPLAPYADNPAFQAVNAEPRHSVHPSLQHLEFVIPETAAWYRSSPWSPW